MYKCRYCTKSFQKARSLQGHLARCKKYKLYKQTVLTDKYLLTEYKQNKRSIPELSKETGLCYKAIHVRLVELGINRSIKQAINLESTKKKRTDTNLRRYGSPHNFCKDHPSRQDWEEKLLKEEGITNVFQRESVKEKIKSTLLDKYGVEHPSSITTSRGKNSFSQLHKDVIEKLSDLNIKCSIEKKINKPNGYYWSFDIYIKPNILIEVNGDYWHGNPHIYKPNDIVLKGSSKEMIVKDIWKRDKKKIEAATRLGYSVIIIWENDWKNKPDEEINRIQNAIYKSKINKENI